MSSTTPQIESRSQTFLQQSIQTKLSTVWYISVMSVVILIKTRSSLSWIKMSFTYSTDHRSVEWRRQYKGKVSTSFQRIKEDCSEDLWDGNDYIFCSGAHINHDINHLTSLIHSRRSHGRLTCNTWRAWLTRGHPVLSLPTRPTRVAPSTARNTSRRSSRVSCSF